jgi:4-hydroxy-3-methylbut-2-enyl diphosphate reductase
MERIGICGATSTPMWLMEQVADHVKNLNLELTTS